MPHPRIDRANRRRQAGPTIGENQLQRLPFESAPIQILQQPLPIGLAFALAAQKRDRKSTRLNSSHVAISYAVFCLKKKKKKKNKKYVIKYIRLTQTKILLVTTKN